MDLITVVIIIVVLVLAFWLLDKYVVPLVPAPWGRVVEAIIAIVVVVWLLNRFLDLGL